MKKKTTATRPAKANARRTKPYPASGIYLEGIAEAMKPLEAQLKNTARGSRDSLRMVDELGRWTVCTDERLERFERASAQALAIVRQHDDRLKTITSAQEVSQQQLARLHHFLNEDSAFVRRLLADLVHRQGLVEAKILAFTDAYRLCENLLRLAQAPDQTQASVVS